MMDHSLYFFFNLSDSSLGDISSLGERLSHLQNNPIDVLSLINNSVGQSNKSPSNPHFSVSSKYVSDLDRVSKRDGRFSVLQLNVQGLCSSFDELKKIVRSGHPDFIGLCETFLDSKNESLLHLPGYKMEYLNRSRMAKGGLAVYVSECLPYSVRHDLSRNEEGIFESIFIEIKTQAKALIVGNIYRSPSGSVPSFLQILDEVLEIIQLHSCELVIMGDFNLNLCDRRSSSSLDFLSTMLACGTLPSACIPTRITNTTASLLDNIFSSLTLVRNSILMSDISDHFPVFSVYDFSDSLPRRSQEAGFSSLKFNDQGLHILRSRLAGRSWSISKNGSDIDSLFNSFYDSLKEVIFDTCDAPQSNPASKRTTPLNPWMTPGLLKSWRKKNYLWKAYRCSKPFSRDSRLQLFKAYRRVYNSLCRRAKSLFYHRKFSACGKDIRKTWQVINSVIRPSFLPPSVPSSVVIDGKNVEGELKVQDAFTSYFANIGKTTASSVSPSSYLPDFRSYLGPPCPKSMALEPVSEAEIARIVNCLRGSSSSGPDRIPTKVVKFILPVILCALTRLVNRSFENGCLPKCSKACSCYHPF